MKKQVKHLTSIDRRVDVPTGHEGNAQRDQIRKFYLLKTFLSTRKLPIAKEKDLE